MVSPRTRWQKFGGPLRETVSKRRQSVSTSPFSRLAQPTFLRKIMLIIICLELARTMMEAKPLSAFPRCDYSIFFHRTWGKALESRKPFYFRRKKTFYFRRKAKKPINFEQNNPFIFDESTFSTKNTTRISGKPFIFNRKNPLIKSHRLLNLLNSTNWPV